MGTRALLLDTCILITFGNAGALSVITGLTSHHLLTSISVIKEVIKPPAADAVRDAAERGLLETVGINLHDDAESAALRRFDALAAFRGRADAEVLALSVSRGYVVCSDDPALVSCARGELGRDGVAGSLDLLIWAIRDGRLGVREATKLLGELDVGPELARRLSKAGKSLGGLV